MILSGYGDVIINNMTEIDFKPFIHGSYEFTARNGYVGFCRFSRGQTTTNIYGPDCWSKKSVNNTVYDGDKLVPHDKKMFFDNLHPNIFGAETYAENLYKFITDNNFL